MNKISVDIDGRQVDGMATLSGGTLWVHLAGETFTVATGSGGRRRAKAGVDANPGEVKAPMPGKIVKIFAKPGEEVTAGQVLLVMEAMKMEYTLKAQVAGKVKTLSAAAGEQVALGQLLVQLEIVVK
jgi:biotin carboxyl carrier protein